MDFTERVSTCYGAAEDVFRVSEDDSVRRCPLCVIIKKNRASFREEISYLMMCTDVNNDGKVDYMEFTERFHNPARDIGNVMD